MEYYKGLYFESVEQSDIGELTEIMKRAFDEDSRRHLGKEAGGPEGYDTGGFLRKNYFRKDVDAYKVTKDNKVIGAIAVFIYESNENYLGNMFIDTRYQDQGIGKVMWSYIEQKYPATRKWSTDTPGFSKRNHNFYVNKCGFHVVRIENARNKNGESYIFEKVMPEHV